MRGHTLWGKKNQGLQVILRGAIFIISLRKFISALYKKRPKIAIIEM
jgi:hypothetical protein